MGVQAETLKSTLRRRCLARRGGISASARAVRSREACLRLLGCDALQQPSAVVGYEPIGGELDPSWAIGALSARGVPVYQPAGWQDDPRFVGIDGDLPLPEPGRRVVVLVPGVAFDAAGGRLGRGGGWYDRVLGSHPDATKIGLAFEEQMVSEVPVEPWDVAMDLVVTDRRVIQARTADVSPRGMST